MSTTKNTRTATSTSTDCPPISLWTPEDGSLGTAVVRIRTLDDLLSERIGVGPVSTIDYPSYDVLHRQLTPARLAVLGSMAGAGPMSIREISRRVQRDFKGVHSDVTTLFRNGLLKKTPDGQMVFPYDGLHFEFDMPTAGLAAAE